MLYLIIMIAMVLAASVGVVVYLRAEGISFRPSDLKARFLTKDETIEFLASKAKLTPEEKEALDYLFLIGGSKRLHAALDGAEVGRKWLVSTRKALFQDKSLSLEKKEQLEYNLYEILRKITNTRNILHPKLLFLKDISVGQAVEIKIANGPKIQADFVEGSGTLTFALTEDFYRILEKNASPKRKLTISFWRKFDAGYIFQAEIINYSHKKGAYMLWVKPITKLKRNKIRLYPRRPAEIPARFRQITLQPDPDTGALNEHFGSTSLGLINDIGPKGCIIAAHALVPIDTQLDIEFPLYDLMIKVKATVRGVFHYENVYTLHIEFQELPQKSILYIYRYIYSDK